LALEDSSPSLRNVSPLVNVTETKGLAMKATLIFLFPALFFALAATTATAVYNLNETRKAHLGE
jgi:hypothetical protein